MFASLVAASVLAASPPATASAPEFDRVVVDGDFPGVDQVEVADVDGDGRPDVVAVGGGTCAWYENPSWKKRVVTAPDQTPRIVSGAPASRAAATASTTSATVLGTTTPMGTWR